MAKQNTDQVVGNQHPKAMAVFLSLDSEGKPIKNLATAHTIVPEIEDIQSIQLTLGSTGTTGQFNMVINNEHNRYFVKDDIEQDIKNLQSGSALTWISDQFRQDGTESKTVEVTQVWDNVQEFLNNESYDRAYTPPGSDENFIYILYKDGVEDDGTPILRYRKIPKAEIETYDHKKEVKTTTKEFEGPLTVEQETAKRRQRLQDAADESIRIHSEKYLEGIRKEIEGDLYGTVKLNSNQVQNILDRTRKQSAFFEEFGGQLEHGRCVFEPMQLCVILMSRRFKDENDPEDMTVVFTGYVDSVSDEFDGKSQLIRIKGSDVTKLLRITLANINPSVFEQGLPAGGEYRIWHNKFSGMLGWQIIKALTMGGYDAANHRIYGAGYFEYAPEGTARNSARENQSNIAEVSAINGMALRRTDIDNNTRSKLDDIFYAPKQVHLQVLPFDTKSKGFADFAAYKKIFSTSFQNWQNEYRNHLELANEVTKLTNYEFYADAFGDIWYHQPRFNNYHLLTAKDAEVYVLRDEDLMNYNFSESDKDVVTTIYVMGQPNYIEISPQIVKMTGAYEDVGLLLKYGRRYLTVQHPYITEAENCFYFAKSLLMRLNAGRFVGTVTLLGRPEIRMHMPVYVPVRNMIYYVTGISHSFKYGQTFTTTLTLKYGHKPWEILPEILDYGVNQASLDSTKNAESRLAKDIVVPDPLKVEPFE